MVVPNSCSQGMQGRFGTKDYTELGVPGGHIGTFVGGKAQKILAPSIVKWLTRSAGTPPKRQPKAPRATCKPTDDSTLTKAPLSAQSHRADP